jgi:Raf kinase inhibitor-like YbhB/YbcL family protein
MARYRSSRLLFEIPRRENPVSLVKERSVRLESPAFEDGSEVPRRYTCEGEDVSVPLRWGDAPSSTKSFAVVCEDPDAPAGTWRHWAIFDIPPDTRELPEGIAKEAHTKVGRQAWNDFKRFGYGGPCPPHGHGVHNYRFRIFALSCDRLDVPVHATCRDVIQAASDSVLAEAQIVGTFARR